MSPATYRVFTQPCLHTHAYLAPIGSLLSRSTYFTNALLIHLSIYLTTASCSPCRSSPHSTPKAAQDAALPFLPPLLTLLLFTLPLYLCSCSRTCAALSPPCAHPASVHPAPLPVKLLKALRCLTTEPSVVPAIRDAGAVPCLVPFLSATWQLQEGGTQVQLEALAALYNICIRNKVRGC